MTGRSMAELPDLARNAGRARTSTPTWPLAEDPRHGPDWPGLRAHPIRQGQHSASDPRARGNGISALLGAAPVKRARSGQATSRLTRGQGRPPKGIRVGRVVAAEKEMRIATGREVAPQVRLPWFICPKTDA